MKEVVELIIGLDKVVSSGKFESVTEAALERMAAGTGRWSRTADAMLSAPEGVWTAWKQILASELVKLRGRETPRQPISAGVGQSVLNTLVWNIAAKERRMSSCQAVEKDRDTDLQGLDAPDWLKQVLSGMAALGKDETESNPFAQAGRRDNNPSDNKLQSELEIDDLYQSAEDWYTILSAVHGFVAGRLGRRLWPEPAYLVAMSSTGWLRFQDLNDAVQYCVWEIEHGS